MFRIMEISNIFISRFPVIGQTYRENYFGVKTSGSLNNKTYLWNLMTTLNCKTNRIHLQRAHEAPEMNLYINLFRTQSLFFQRSYAMHHEPLPSPLLNGYSMFLLFNSDRIEESFCHIQQYILVGGQQYMSNFQGAKYLIFPQSLHQKKPCFRRMGRRPTKWDRGEFARALDFLAGKADSCSQSHPSWVSVLQEVVHKAKKKFHNIRQAQMGLHPLSCPTFIKNMKGKERLINSSILKIMKDMLTDCNM